MAQNNTKPQSKPKISYYTLSNKFSEIFNLQKEFNNYNATVGSVLENPEHEKSYFEFLINLLPSIIEQLDDIAQNDFYSELHYVFQRCPNIEIDFESIHPSFCPPATPNADNSKKYCFTLTLDKVKSLIEDGQVSTSNIHQLNARELKNSIINWYYLTDTLKSIQNNLTIQYDTADVKDLEKRTKIKSEIDYVKSKVKHLEEQIEKNTSRLNEISDLKSLHSTMYQVPKTNKEGTSEFSAEEAVFRVSYFSADGKTQFSEFYDKLKLFVESKNLNEKGVISLFGALLKGEPFQTFMEFYKQNTDLQTLINGLSSRYSDKKTISQYERMLRNTTRQPGENLRSIMSRVSYLISMTNSLLPSQERTARLKHLQQEYLIKFASEKAKNEIQKYILNSHREGLYVDYQTLFNLAIDIEADDNSMEHYFSQ